MSLNLGHIDTLVLSGGSFKGYSYIGVFRKLEEYGISSQIKTVSACSVGSIFGLLFVLKYQYQEMLTVIGTIDPSVIYQFNIKSFADNYGFSDFNTIKQAIVKFLVDKGLTEQCTFLQLYNLTNINLIINATCITTQTTSYFHYITHPDMSVVTAIQMSTALPLIFPRVKYKNKYYVDGGLLDNLPIFPFKDKNHILAISLTESKTKSNDQDISLVEYINTILNTIFKQYQQLKEQLHYPNCCIIRIQTKANVFTCNLSQTEINCLINDGYIQTGYYLLYWSQKYKLTIQPKIKLNITFKQKQTIKLAFKK